VQKFTKEVIKLIGATLRNDAKVLKLYTGHCTGDAGYRLLQDEMGAKIEPMMVGKQMVV